MPTLDAFNTFIRDVVQIPVEALPDDAPVIVLSYQVAISTVNQALYGVSLLTIPNMPNPPGWDTFFDVASYNLGASILLNWAQDQDGETFFEDLRDRLHINSFVPGLIQSSTDSSTSQTTQLIDAMKNMTLSDLQRLKDPYGRVYLGIAQAYGRLWGLS